MTAPVFAGGGIGVFTRSLNFGSGNNRYLSISQTDFNYSSLNKDKCAFAGTFYISNFGTGKNIFQKTVSSSSSEFDFSVQANGAVQFTVYSGTPGSPWQLISTSSAATAGSWNAYLVYFDRSNGTTADRMRIWINGTEITRASYTAPTAGLSTSGGAFRYGWDDAQELDGLLFSPAVFSNYLPTTSEIFNGSAGKVKRMNGITGAHSILDTRDGKVTSDYVLTPDWTNTNGVTASFTLP